MNEYDSNISDFTLISILDELQLVTNPFVGMRVFIKKINISVIITEVLNNKVTGFAKLYNDNVDALIDELFDVKFVYDFGIREVSDGYDITKLEYEDFNNEAFEVFETDLNVCINFTNLHAFIDGEERRIYKVFINGTEITRDVTGEFNYRITNSIGIKKFIIKIEVLGIEVYVERTIRVVPRTKVKFLSSRELSDNESFSKFIVLPALGGLYYDGIFVNNSSDLNYLWVVSPWEINSVTTSEDPKFDIDGFITENRDGVYCWRSYNKLNSGNWQLNVK